MSESVRPYLPTAVLALLILYFGVQALTGERGLLGGAERDRLMSLRQAELAALTEQREDLELRVRYLRSDSLSRDLLEERARVILGFSDPRDYVIPVSRTQSAAS